MACMLHPGRAHLRLMARTLTLTARLIADIATRRATDTSRALRNAAQPTLGPSAVRWAHGRAAAPAASSPPAAFSRSHARPFPHAGTHPWCAP